MQAPYGRWGNGGTCKKACEQIKESQDALSRFVGTGEAEDDVRHKASLPMGDGFHGRPRRRTNGRVDV